MNRTAPIHTNIERGGGGGDTVVDQGHAHDVEGGAPDPVEGLSQQEDVEVAL